MPGVDLRDIYWGHDGDRVHYAKGHIDPVAFVDELALEEGIPDDAKPALVPEVRHLWGRWTPRRRGEFDIYLNVVPGPGRGVFPFTMIDP